MKQTMTLAEIEELEQGMKTAISMRFRVGEKYYWLTQKGVSIAKIPVGGDEYHVTVVLLADAIPSKKFGPGFERLGVAWDTLDPVTEDG